MMRNLVRTTPTLWQTALAFLALCGTLWEVDPAGGQEPPRPNIILILVDDMGWSDLGCYGGEIETPQIDQLAAKGLRFSQFYNCAKCETTRATLLSGRYHPEVGIGKLKRCATIAQVLSGAGYQTWITGKWHQSGSPLDHGFQRYFGHLSGATNFFTGDKTFRLDREVFQVPKEGFYTTDADTDYAMQFIRERKPDQPFFLYLAYNAPHYPLQAPQEDVLKYRGKYQVGWDEIRRQRLESIKQLQLLPEGVELSARPADIPDWERLTEAERDEQDLVMATYAAMIDRVDQNIGRLMQCLEDEGQRENTLVLLLSDNGACPYQRTKKPTLEQQLMPWDPKSYWTYDQRWANACNTPFRAYKRNQHEGGIRTPMVAYWPAGIAKPGSLTHQPGHIVDMAATFVELSGATYPPPGSEPDVGALRGASLLPVFRGDQRADVGERFFTFYGTHNALRLANWKLVNRDQGPWELYDLAEDPNETRNLAETHAEQLVELRKKWRKLADEMGVKRKRKERGGTEESDQDDN